MTAASAHRGPPIFPLHRAQLDEGWADTEAEYERAAWQERSRAAWEALAPRHFRDATIDDVWIPDIAERMRAWLAAPDCNVVIFGDLGTGKTYESLALCRALIDAGRRAVWYPTVELLEELRPNGNADVKTFAAVEFLVLDDLGGEEKRSDWTAERLYLIVNRRWLENRPTIVTTNLDPAGLEAAVGARTYDRLRDGAVTWKIEGDTHRKPAPTSSPRQP